MKKLLIVLLLNLSLGISGFTQDINGVIIADTNLLKIVGVWGTHQERGLAYGYLTGDEITTIFSTYIKPSFGNYYSNARGIINEAKDITIDSIYQVEAKAVIEGMNLAGTNTSNLDYIDILVGNSFLDIKAMLSFENKEGCSSLMSWGDATMGTTLNGKSVITRHLDWTTSSILASVQIMTVHIPSETDEQPWITLGFAGMISALSGMNASLGAFQHMMSDFSSGPVHNQAYSPIWFQLRTALESNDYNQDGKNNVQDVRSVLESQIQGTADGYLISALARSDEENDTLVAMIAELAPLSPKLNFRYNTFPDSIPGDNLYTANYQICRNNMLHFCNRYNAVKNNIGDGTLIDFHGNWTLMRDFSHQSNNNQCMAFSPELDLLRVTVYKPGVPAYNAEPIDFSLSWLFGYWTKIEESGSYNALKVCPVPASDFVSVSGFQITDKPLILKLYSETGELLRTQSFNGTQEGIKINVSTLKQGVFLLKLIDKDKIYTGKLVVIH